MADASEPTFELARFYPLGEFRAEWAAYFGEQATAFPVPVTVTVVNDSRVTVPRGRGYHTPWLAGESDEEDPDAVIMFEVYRQKHSLMHAYWVLVGFVFLPRRLSAQWVGMTAEAVGVPFDELVTRCLAHFARDHE